MEKAIKRAIEGGYRKDDPLVATGQYFSMVGDQILIDVEFWQALAEYEGWNKSIYKRFFRYKTKRNMVKERIKSVVRTKKHGYKKYMHRFIDHLIAGKDVDSFFNDLLKDVSKRHPAECDCYHCF